MTPRYTARHAPAPGSKTARRRKLRRWLWACGYAFGVVLISVAAVSFIYGILIGSPAVQGVALATGAAGYAACRALE